MFRLSILRAACAAILAAALILPTLVEAFERGPSGSAECRCSNHACCTTRIHSASPSGAACPLARAGQDCARSRPEPAPGWRAGCGCHQGGEHAALAAPKAALVCVHRSGLEPPSQAARPYSAPRTPRSSPLFAPEPPPPRPALRCA